MVIVEIIDLPIDPFPSDDGRLEQGSELIFNGRVRSKENGQEIKELEYEQYEGMAESELKRIAIETANIYPISDLFCKHRVGTVAVGETSLHVVIWSKHRNEGLEAITFFISELKKHVPIWKWAILKDGTKIPSECRYH